MPPEIHHGLGEFAGEPIGTTIEGGEDKGQLGVVPSHLNIAGDGFALGVVADTAEVVEAGIPAVHAAGVNYDYASASVPIRRFEEHRPHRLNHSTLLSPEL